MNLSDCLQHSVYCYGHKLALIDGKRELTYSDLDIRVNKLANVLLALGLQSGDKVSIILENSIEFVESMCAITRAGLTFVPINNKLKAKEIQYILEHSDSKALIVGAIFLEEVKNAWDVIKSTNILVVGKHNSIAQNYEEALENEKGTPPNFVIKPSDTFFIGYTSGTTGRPKGVVVSHQSRILNCLVAAQKYRLGESDVGLMCTPMYHGGPMIFVIISIMTGGLLVIMESFDPEIALFNIEKYGVTNAFVVPTILNRFSSLLDEQFKKYDLRTLKTLVSNAGPLPTKTKLDTLDRFPLWVELHELYGSTEASLVTNLNPEYQREKIMCCGQPLLWVEIKLLDDDGNEVEIGKPGELYSKSPFNFDGYYKNEEETNKALRSDGFLSVGDVAIRDKDNFFYIVGRKKEMIISGGVNIYPREIEEVLNTHPKIQQSAIIGIPDPDWGEQVKAFIELKPRESLSSEEVITFSKQHLANFKAPRIVEFIDHMPTGPTGKILKHELQNKDGDRS